MLECSFQHRAGNINYINYCKKFNEKAFNLLAVLLAENVFLAVILKVRRK